MNRDDLHMIIKKKRKKEFINKKIIGDFYLDEFEGINFIGCNFEADLSGMSLLNTSFKKCVFNKSRLRFITYNQNTFINCAFIDCNEDYQIIIKNKNNISRTNLSKKFIIELYNVQHGWFEFYMLQSERACFITESDYVDCDAPRKLLNILISFVENSNTVYERWLCWSDEPGAYIMKLTYCNSIVTFEVYGTDAEAYEIAYNSEDELSKVIDKLVFSCSSNINNCIKEVLNLYRRIISKIGYKGFEEHWFEYPKKEIEKLYSIISEWA